MTRHSGFTRRAALLSGAVTLAGCASLPIRRQPDILIRNGLVLDGTGREGVRADIAIHGDTISAIGNLSDVQANSVIDASDLVVCPGFINSLSWSTNTLFADPRCMSDVMQGVTTQVVGEGTSMGPLNTSLRDQLANEPFIGADDIAWSTLGGFLSTVEARGLSPNIVSFVGAASVRRIAIGDDNRSATADELQEMERLVRQAMADGAIGVSSSLIYPPATSADLQELSALAAASAPSGGLYATHMRSEGDNILDALDETLAIASSAGVCAEIFHLKVAGVRNWPKAQQVLDKINAAREEGVCVAASLYPYVAGATSLAAMFPPWVWDGGFGALLDRLDDSETRRKIDKEVESQNTEWESLYALCGGADGVEVLDHGNVLPVALQGERLSTIARHLEMSPVESAMHLIRQSGEPLEAAYFAMNEETVRKILVQPWVSICSDSGAPSIEPPFTEQSVHPRAFGAFARILERYVRNEGIISLPDAVHRMTGLPASKFGLSRRGILRAGNFADITIFDPAGVRERATFTRPYAYAEGIQHVLTNGVPIVELGQHTGQLPGRALRGGGFVSA